MEVTKIKTTYSFSMSNHFLQTSSYNIKLHKDIKRQQIYLRCLQHAQITPEISVLSPFLCCLSTAAKVMSGKRKAIGCHMIYYKNITNTKAGAALGGAYTHNQKLLLQQCKHIINICSPSRTSQQRVNEPLNTILKITCH